MNRHETTDDHELIRQFQEGRRWAFDALMSRHEQHVYRIALGMLGDRDQALDIVQETFLNAFRSLKHFEFRSGFGTWLHRIAVNLCLSHMRKTKLRSLGSLAGLSGLLISSIRGPEQDLAVKDLNLRIEEAVASLPPRQKAIFLMRYREDLPFASIAEIMDRTEGAVRAGYFQALRKLRARLANIV